jgi:hypothetical protein
MNAPYYNGDDNRDELTTPDPEIPMVCATCGEDAEDYHEGRGVYYCPFHGPDREPTESRIQATLDAA